MLLLVGRFVPNKAIRVRKKDDQCTRAFCLKQEAHLRWTSDRSRVNWEEFVRCQVRANETYSDKIQFSVRNRDVLMNALSPHKWWSTLKSAVFGVSSSLPPFVGEGGCACWCACRLVWLICSQIILLASSPRRLLCRLLAIRL